MSMINYVKESKSELQKVKWPSKEQTMRYTKMVITMSIFVSLLLGALDYIFNLIIAKVL